ncbi:MAG TPA: hypothetical protein VMV46_06740 [Thermoanaerobaculia bacterium]|nr:hypothetical protein [Thermoanaerobaculia bacterium]
MSTSGRSRGWRVGGWLLAGALAVAPSGAQPQFLTDEVQVNGDSRSRQRAPIAVKVDGERTLVVWQEDRHGVFGRLLDATGAPLGEDLALAPSTRHSSPYYGVTRERRDPAAVALAGGGVLVAWTQEQQQLSTFPFIESRRLLASAVYAQVFDPTGEPAGPARRLERAPGVVQRVPELAVLADGRVLAAWLSELDHGTAAVRARLLDAGGVPAGESFELGVATNDATGGLGLTAHPDGVALATWHACCDAGGDAGVFARIVDPEDPSSGAVVRVNDVQEHSQAEPAAAVLADGELLVVWSSSTGIPDPLYHRRRVRGQRLAVDGTLLGGESELSAGFGWGHTTPDLAVGPEGEVLLTWLVWNADFPVAVRARALDADGEPHGAPFAVNASRAVGFPSVSTLGDGLMVVTWIGITERQRAVSARFLQVSDEE